MRAKKRCLCYLVAFEQPCAWTICKSHCVGSCERAPKLSAQASVEFSKIYSSLDFLVLFYQEKSTYENFAS